MDTITQRLLAGSADIWESYLEHPFVKGIADGTLPPEKFRFYMVQDYHYLLDYARVFAIGAAKARTEEDMRVFSSYLHQILDGEMELHRGYMAQLGISPEAAAAVPMSLANSSYTAWMLRVAYEEGPAQIAAAILSCAISYQHIAQKITERFPAAGEHPFYGEWVRSYADPEYAAANQILIDLTERLCAGMSEAEQARLTELFRTASRFEAMFWDMAWNTEA